MFKTEILIFPIPKLFLLIFPISGTGNAIHPHPIHHQILPNLSSKFTLTLTTSIATTLVQTTIISPKLLQWLSESHPCSTFVFLQSILCTAARVLFLEKHIPKFFFFTEQVKINQWYFKNQSSGCLCGRGIKLSIYWVRA